jgi:DNA-binding transcriptional MocR family regulator
MDITLDSSEATPVVEQVVRAIRNAIQRGELKPGERLPSIRQLVSEQRLSFHTVVGAYERLEIAGLIASQPGRGFFVRTLPSTRPPSWQPPVKVDDAGKLSAFWQIFHGADYCMKLGCGWLPAGWRDTKELARHIRRTANSAHSSLVEYGDPSGYLPLRQNLAQHLGRKLQLSLDPSLLLTTLGATQALDLVIRQLIAPGDEVLVDDPCNSNLVQLLKLRGARISGIARRPAGPDLAAMAKVLAERKVKAFFINSQLHNPTGTSLSPQSAFQLLQLAYANDVILVEDDVYGDFSTEPNRLVTLDGLHKVVYISSFSKTLSANLRVGYVVAPAPLVAALADLKLLTSVAVPNFCERFLSSILVDGTYAKHVQLVQRKLQTAQVVAQESFRRWGWELFHTPKEGLFLWVRHPHLDDPEAFIQKAFQHDILLAPGRLFSVAGEPNPWLRINVAHLDVEKAEVLFSHVD